MKIVKMKRVLAAAMSTAMVMSMPMAALAADLGTTPVATPVPTSSSADVEAPIYSFDKIDVVVPTALVVAFNPDKLGVDVGGTDLSTDQVLSKNFGILNKSNKDKIVTVTLKVEDLNEDQIAFVGKDDITDATKVKEGDYAIYLAAVPADTTQVKVGDTPSDAAITTDQAAMGSVTMTGASTQAQTLDAGNNTMAFVLKKATYEPKSTGGIELGTSTGNAVGDNMELTAVDKEKGITAFTFTGALNEKADWSKLTKAIKITAVYNFETTYDYDTLTGTTGGSVVSGTGAMLSALAPKFTTGSGAGMINYSAGVGDDGVKSITSIVMMSGENPFDGYNALSGAWGAASDENGTITFDTAFTSAFARDFPDETKEVTITYVTNDDQTKTVTVDVKLR